MLMFVHWHWKHTQTKLIQHEIFNEWNPMWLLFRKNIVIVCDFYFLRHEIPMKKNKMTEKPNKYEYTHNQSNRARKTKSVESTYMYT